MKRRTKTIIIVPLFPLHYTPKSAFVCGISKHLTTKMTTAVAQWFVLWAVDEEVPNSIPDRTDLGIDFFLNWF